MKDGEQQDIVPCLIPESAFLRKWSDCLKKMGFFVTCVALAAMTYAESYEYAIPFMS